MTQWTNELVSCESATNNSLIHFYKRCIHIFPKLKNHEQTKDKCFLSPCERRFTPSNGQDVLEEQRPESIQALLEVP